MKPSSPVIGRPVQWLLILAVVLFGGYFLWSLGDTKMFSRLSISELQTEYGSIPPPAGAVRIGDVNTSSQLVRQFVTADFVTRLSQEDTLRHFSDTLVRLGWRKVEQRIRGTGYHITYCKADIDASIETAAAKSGGTSYSLTITRRDSGRIKTGC